MKLIKAFCIFIKMYFLFFIFISLQYLSGNPIDKKLTIATVTSPPLCDESLPEGGFYTAITREAFKRAGYTIDVVFVPWKRGLEATKNGFYDGLMLASYKEERTQYLKYTDYIVEEESVFIGKNRIKLRKATLKNVAKGEFIISVLLAGIISDILKDNNIVNLYDVYNFDQAFILLEKDRVDLIAGPKLLLIYMINTNYPDLKKDIKVFSPSFRNGKLYNVLSLKLSDYEKITQEFNKELRKLKKDGTYTRMLKKHGLTD